MQHTGGLKRVAILAALAASFGACATGMPRAVRQQHAAPATTALQAGRFEDAKAAAEKVLAQQPGAVEAHLVFAIAQYRETMHGFVAAMFGATSMVMGNSGYGTVLRNAIKATESDLAIVEQHLSKAVVDDISLDLCLACWDYDWNHSGQVDENDRHLMEVEMGADGEPYPDGDPRRRPTFHFDVGDVHWARAMISFQRAVFDFVLAFRFEDAIAQALQNDDQFRIPLDSKERITAMRTRLLEGFGHSDASRLAIVAETDDDREWVPNPGQKNHPLPLPVDQKLFDTWATIVDDLRKLVKGQESIDVAQAAQAGDHQWKNPPQGFINIGTLFEHPNDIVISKDQAESVEDQERKAVEKFLSTMFGAAYVPSAKASGLITHLRRMRDEVEGGQESIERKLRYLLWLN
jgi:hypothetical protein